MQNLEKPVYAKFNAASDQAMNFAKAGIFPINSPRTADFVDLTRRKQTVKTLLEVDEAKQRMHQHQSRLFEWLRESELNAAKYVVDPLGALSDAGVHLNEDDIALLAKVGNSLKDVPYSDSEEGLSFTHCDSSYAPPLNRTETSTAFTSDTKGWDIVAGITQASLNANLKAAFEQSLFPSEIDAELDFGGKSTLKCKIGAPRVDLAGVTPGIANAEIPIISGSFDAAGFKNFDLAGGTVTISTALNQIETTVEGTSEVKVYLDLLNDQAVYAVKMSGLDKTQEVILNALIALGLTQVKPGSYFLGSVDITKVGQIPDYLMPRLVAYTMVSAADKNPDQNALLIMVQTIGSGGSKDYSESTIPIDQTSSLLLSNERLLVDFIGDQLKGNIAGSNFSYDSGKLSLVNQVKYGEYQLTGLVAEVISGKIQLTFKIAAEGEFGGGINVYVDAPADISLSIKTEPDGTQTIVPSTEAKDTDSSWTLEWWVYAAAVASGGTVMGLVGAIIATIISVILGVIADSIGSNLAKDKLSAELSAALTPISWPAAKYYELTGVSIPSSLSMTGNPKV